MVTSAAAHYDGQTSNHTYYRWSSNYVAEKFQNAYGSTRNNFYTQSHNNKDTSANLKFQNLMGYAYFLRIERKEWIGLKIK